MINITGSVHHQPIDLNEMDEETIKEKIKQQPFVPSYTKYHSKMTFIPIENPGKTYFVKEVLFSDIYRIAKIIIPANDNPTLDDLHSYILDKHSPVEIKGIIEYGIVKPTNETLDLAIQSHHDFDMIMTMILSGGVKPTLDNLHQLYRSKHADSWKLTIWFLKKGLKPTLETLELAIKANEPPCTIQHLLETGIIPTPELIALAKEVGLSRRSITCLSNHLLL